VAVAGARMFLGLRGPVLRGWAVLLEIAVEPAVDPRFLQLKEVRPGIWYHTHFLHLDGLGVRDLCCLHADLLIVAGPTMALDGPVRMYRWKDALTTTDAQVVSHPDLVREVPCGTAGDHAEGFTLLTKEDAEPAKVLVVYDSPAKHRLQDATGVRADVFAV
jgi:hypothetical protein